MSDAAAPHPHRVVVEGAASGFAQRIDAGGHPLAADEPAASGGTGTGPGPYELLLSALGACKSMTVSMYARRKQWPLEHVRVALSHGKVPSDDGPVDRIECELAFSGDLDGEQRARLLEIAERCPVHRTLMSDIEIRSREARS